MSAERFFVRNLAMCGFGSLREGAFTAVREVAENAVDACSRRTRAREPGERGREAVRVDVFTSTEQTGGDPRSKVDTFVLRVTDTGAGVGARSAVDLLSVFFASSNHAPRADLGTGGRRAGSLGRVGQFGVGLKCTAVWVAQHGGGGIRVFSAPQRRSGPGGPEEDSSVHVLVARGDPATGKVAVDSQRKVMPRQSMCGTQVELSVPWPSDCPSVPWSNITAYLAAMRASLALSSSNAVDMHATVQRRSLPDLVSLQALHAPIPAAAAKRTGAPVVHHSVGENARPLRGGQESDGGHQRVDPTVTTVLTSAAIEGGEGVGVLAIVKSTMVPVGEEGLDQLTRGVPIRVSVLANSIPLGQSPESTAVRDPHCAVALALQRVRWNEFGLAWTRPGEAEGGNGPRPLDPGPLTLRTGSPSASYRDLVVADFRPSLSARLRSPAHEQLAGHGKVVAGAPTSAARILVSLDVTLHVRTTHGSALRFTDFRKSRLSGTEAPEIASHIHDAVSVAMSGQKRAAPLAFLDGPAFRRVERDCVLIPRVAQAIVAIVSRAAPGPERERAVELLGAIEDRLEVGASDKLKAWQLLSVWMQEMQVRQPTPPSPHTQ